jgi:sigma-B regulation protein RsbU (phosphoserine phosphatase)
VLDVSGHGVPSALLAVQASRLLTPLMSAGSILKAPLAGPPGYRLMPPRDVLTELNRAFPFQDENPQFFTILYAQLELATHRLVLASAGHPGPILVRNGAAGEIPMPSNPIGLLAGEEAEFTLHELTLHPGDRLYLYSDGVTEALDRKGGIFGLDRLAELLSTSAQRGDTIAASITAVQRELKAWRGGAPAADDVSLLAIERQR